MQKAVFAALGALAQGLARTARLMVGLPDYDAYVAHRRRTHPGEPIMSYEDFFRERQANRMTSAMAKWAVAADASAHPAGCD